MSKAALSLVAVVIALALQGCIFPYAGNRSESGVPPSEVSSNVTTRAELLKKAPPDLRTPDNRFFLYQNTGSEQWNLCFIGPNGGCGPAGTAHWARWVVIEFDERGVVKGQITEKCEHKVCGCPQAALLGVLEGYYSPALAAEYGQAFEREDPLYGLHQAVARGDVQQVKKVLEQGADTNVKVCDHFPLHMASTQGNLAVAELLLKAGADVNARDTQGRTALHLAVSESNTVLAERLLAGGADVNAEDKTYATPLLLVSQGDSQMIALLRAHGAAEVDQEQRMLRRIAGEWRSDGQSRGRSVQVKYVFQGNGAFVYDWLYSLGSGHVEEPPGTLHLNGEKLEYKDAEGLLWTFTLDEDKKGRNILHVQSKEGSWTLER